MYNVNLNDTIAAIATPIGDGGIGIVRLSGKDALAIADKIFVSKDKKKPSGFKTYTTHYGCIVDKSKVVDEVILTIMRSPRSYTKEDIVEINCHGGIVALRAVLDLVLANGTRLAEPGEFTKRAFLNGRIDLSQAEAVLDIIKAKTDSALKISLQQLKGSLSAEINKIRKDLLDMLSLLEANIDFPEEDLSVLGLGEIKHGLETVNKKFSVILDTSGCGRIMREGINAVICGKPNVGKSSLLNALLKQERSIVTPIAGTTRDTIEEIIDIRGIPVKIVDTAGMLEPRDLIEKKAVLRSKKYIDAADLVLILFDGSKKLSRQDDILIKRLKNKTAIAIINKIDLYQKINKEKISSRFSHLIEISAKKSKNIVLLEETIAGLVYKGKVAASESVLVSNQRHIEALRHAQKLVAEANKSLDNRLSVEFIAQGLKDALIYLDELLGKKFSEDLLDKIFAEFCIGK
ncbi:MAG: tRNA uridine-5-carboxymethylaminomethyl(34) synthesis GTPase MnmE [Candidatus Omnitrophica bacterium]|jgi:tRNA modification GTPase|nr:tRNA uridine-5-carboxymethylaminomethyl(34) synthesis GTPase MnmE [Candidatus Omnitrophota bacterium]